MMAKVTNPLLSGDVRGQFGHRMIYRRGGVVTRMYRPRNPNSELQQAQRQYFKENFVGSLTQEQADLLYSAITHLHDERYLQSVPQQDHGGLLGLADDDHSQYYNQNRGDLRYAFLDHEHENGGGGILINYLMNGGFNFNKRKAPGSAIAMSDVAYNSPDRFYSLVQGANATICRATGIGTSRYACKIVAGGTTNRYGIAQVVPGADSISLRGQTVIAQFRIKPVNNSGDGTRNYRIAILEWTGTVNEVTKEVVSDWTSGVYTCGNFFANTTLTLVGCAAKIATHNTETVISVYGSVSISCNNLIVFLWTEDIPTHASDYLLVAEAGLYAASSEQAWTPLSFNEEEVRCLPFFRKSYNRDVAPGTASGVVGVVGINFRMSGMANNAHLFRLPAYFDPPMFKDPTMTWYAYASGNAGYVTINGADKAAATVLLGETMAVVEATSSSTSDVDMIACYTADAEL